MYSYIMIFGKMIPTYGLMIFLGLAVANVIAYVKIRNTDLDFNDVWILEGYLLLGAFAGAKLLYLWVSRGDIEWERILDIAYFNNLMRGGFVFYGGLLGGVLAVLLAEKIHHLQTKLYVPRLIFLAPLVHGFGRLGCFLAGCCYGIHYQGPLAVRFPENSLAPAGISLFPVQAAEAVLLFVLSLAVYKSSLTEKKYKPVMTYFLGYAFLRFVMEFLRADQERGAWLFLSTSQWISLFVFAGAGIWIVRNKIQQRS